MLAEIGFIITGLCFAGFAYTFGSKVIDKTNLDLHQFVYAYYCLALALLTWGFAAAIGDTDTLRRSVIIGDAFLLAGTLFMLDLLLGKKKRYLVWLAALLSVVMVWSRIDQLPPSPYMKDGILIFNSQTAVQITLGLIFLLIWLPVNMRVAKQVTHKIKQDSLATMYSYIYIGATISALIFIAARRTATVVVSFIALGICFFMLFASNFLVESVEEHHGKPRKHK